MSGGAARHREEQPRPAAEVRGTQRVQHGRAARLETCTVQGGAVRMAEKWRIGCELSSEKGRSKLQSNFTPGILSHVSAPWPLRGCPWHRHCFSSAAGMQWEFQELWHGAMYTGFSLGHLSSQLLPPITRIPSYLILGCEIGGQKVLTGLPPVSQSPPHLFGSICAP